MTLAAVPQNALTVLSSDGGVFVPMNCPTCRGGFTVEASSRGREDLAFPCREVRASLFCVPCKERYVFEGKLGIATRQRTPERRYTGR